jgi:hypothetical protein
MNPGEIIDPPCEDGILSIAHSTPRSRRLGLVEPSLKGDRPIYRGLAYNPQKTETDDARDHGRESDFVVSGAAR